MKHEVSLARLLEGQGHRLVSQGKDLACRCPWHEGDDTPSCIVTPKTNLWHCFGCNAGGTVIDWVMRSHRISFRHACELLSKQHPALAASASPTSTGASGKLSAGKLRQAQSFSLAAADQTRGDQMLLDQVIDFYHADAQDQPGGAEVSGAVGAWATRSSSSASGWGMRTARWRIGWRPKQYKAGAELRTALQRVGILRDSGHEHFNGSIVVPLWAAPSNGAAPGSLAEGGPGPADSLHVVGAYARKIHDNLRAGTPKHLYLPGPHRGVLNREGLEGQSEVIVCEALLDALTFWTAGYRNVTSCYGVNGFTEELLGALKTCGAQRILIAFDRDEAGDRAAEAAGEAADE